MKEIILGAMKKCAMRYAKNIPRYINVWDEKLTMEQKAEEIANELRSMSYKIQKITPEEEGIFDITTLEGE
jgi:DNA topoisomerase VI subunit B